MGADHGGRPLFRVRDPTPLADPKQRPWKPHRRALSLPTSPTQNAHPPEPERFTVRVRGEERPGPAMLSQGSGRATHGFSEHFEPGIGPE